MLLTNRERFLHIGCVFAKDPQKKPTQNTKPILLTNP